MLKTKSQQGSGFERWKILFFVIENINFTCGILAQVRADYS